MDSTVKSLQEVLKMVERKLWLAQTSIAAQKPTGKATIQRLAAQCVALEIAIERCA